LFDLGKKPCFLPAAYALRIADVLGCTVDKLYKRYHPAVKGKQNVK